MAVPAETAAKAAFAVALRDSGLSRTGLAERLGIDEAAVRKMLDPRHRGSVNRIHRALRVLDYILVVEAHAA